MRDSMTTKTLVEEVTPSEVAKRLSEGKRVSLIDVREDEEVAEGAIPGVKHIPLGELEDRMHEIEKDKEHILVYRSSARSGRAAEFLKHPHVISQDELSKKIEGDEKITILDVRESAEYAFGHIPGAIHIPLGELENRFTEIDKNSDIHVVCRTGSRSDFAAQKLAEKGFEKVKNVVLGMKEWTGPTNKTH